MKSSNKQRKVSKDSKKKQQTPPPSIPPSPDDDSTSETTNKDDKTKYRKIYDWVKTRKSKNVISFTQMIATLVFIWVAVIQNRHTEHSAIASSDAVNEMKNQFILSNTPILAITEYKIDSILSGRPIKINFELISVGQQPIKLEYIRGGIFVEPDSINDDTFNPFDSLTEKPHNYPDYVSTTVSSKQHFYTIKQANNGLIRALRSKEVKIYWATEITYFDPINKGRGKLYYNTVHTWNGVGLNQRTITCYNDTIPKLKK